MISVTEFEKALLALKEALDMMDPKRDPIELKVIRDGSIQRFEFCVELAWKVSAKILGSSSTTAKPVIREMAQNQFISDPTLWFTFIDARNNSSHSYDEEVAKKVFTSVLVFLPEGSNLLKIFKSKTK